MERFRGNKGVNMAGTTNRKKSQSQRLRGALFRLYEQRGDQSIPFDRFYAQQMERIISAVKKGLKK